MTENGWPACGPDQLDRSPIPGTDVVLPLQIGWPNTVMKAFAADINRFVEPLDGRPDIGGWTPTNSVATSNHLGGTAMDLAWNNHPFHVRGTYSPEQQATIRALLDFYEGNIFWGADWSDPIDEMHYQMGYGTFNNPAVGDFIARKIVGPPWFSTFRSGGGGAPAGPDPAQVLYDVMLGDSNPLTLDRYRQLLPGFQQALRDIDANTVERIAMFAAQLGEESGGLQWMEELASGAEYEGRADLGNTQPGDGVRFKGRGPIQVTGRHNYTQVSQWAFDQGLVPSPTYFVDTPAELASDRYGFVGPTWYWTVARDMNSYADARDVVGATRAVNGGLNGLADRQARWDNAIAMGPTLFDINQGGFLMALSDDEQRELLTKTRMVWDQLLGPNAHDGGPTGWPQLGGLTPIDALGQVRDQLLGPDGRGWPQLGKNAQGQNLTVVDALAERLPKSAPNP